MTDGPEQTNADAGATQAEATSSADSDLDTLLNDWSKGEEKPVAPQPDVSKLLESLRPVVKYAESSMQEKAVAAEQKVIDDSIAFIKSDEALKEIPDDIAFGYLLAKHSRDSSFRTAFDNRGSNPDAWTKALEGVQTGLTEDVNKLPGNNVRSDVEAAAAAIAGSSSEALPNDGPSVSQKIDMNDVDWQRHVEKRAAEPS